MRIYIIENGEKLYWTKSPRSKFWSKYKQQIGCKSDFSLIESLWLRYNLWLMGLRGHFEK